MLNADDFMRGVIGLCICENGFLKIKKQYAINLSLLYEQSLYGIARAIIEDIEYINKPLTKPIF